MRLTRQGRRRAYQSEHRSETVDGIIHCSSYTLPTPSAGNFVCTGYEYEYVEEEAGAVLNLLAMSEGQRWTVPSSLPFGMYLLRMK